MEAHPVDPTAGSGQGKCCPIPPACALDPTIKCHPGSSALDPTVVLSSGGSHFVPEMVRVTAGVQAHDILPRLGQGSVVPVGRWGSHPPGFWQERVWQVGGEVFPP